MVETLSRDGRQAPSARPTRNWRQMIDNKRMTPFIGVLGAMALMVSAPAFAQPAATNAADAAATAPAATNAPAAAADENPPTLDSTMKKGSGKLTVAKMFAD